MPRKGFRGFTPSPSEPGPPVDVPQKPQAFVGKMRKPLNRDQLGLFPFRITGG